MQAYGERSTRTTRLCEAITERIASDPLFKCRGQRPFIVEAVESSPKIDHLRICLRQRFQWNRKSTEERSPGLSNCH